MTTREPLTAIVPIKHNSARVPGKNLRPFAGLPLFHHILDALESSTLIDMIVVDTDSEDIARSVAESRPHVTVLPRPSHLAQPETPMNDVLEHTIAQLAGDFFLQAHTTSPLLTAPTIDSAIEAFWAHWPTHDSLFSVSKKQERLWSRKGVPLNHDPQVLLPTQDLEPFFVENSCLYVFNRDVFLDHSSRIGSRPYLFETPDLESIDIDVESDFIIGEAIASRDVS